jgi:hypothetical protein
MNDLADANYESGRNKRNTLTENIGRSGLGKKFWNIKVKKCRVKAAANKHECRSANPRRDPFPDVGNKVPPMRDLPQVRSAIDVVDGARSRHRSAIG